MLNSFPWSFGPPVCVETSTGRTMHDKNAFVAAPSYRACVPSKDDGHQTGGQHEMLHLQKNAMFYDRSPAFAAFLILLMFTACGFDGNINSVDENDFGYPIASLRTDNVRNLSRLEIGMSKAQAAEIMGTQAARENFLDGPFTVTNPFRVDTFRTGCRVFEIYYYYTDYVPTRGPGIIYGATMPPFIRDQHLTPLVFQEEKLLGWGRKFLVELERSSALKIGDAKSGPPVEVEYVRRSCF